MKPTGMDGQSVDLNSDLGESFGPYSLGHDEEVLALVSSANVACGFHAADPLVMERTIALCRKNGVAVGAHPGFPDRVGFGRRVMDVTGDEVRTDVMYQIGALQAFCASAGLRLQHVKPHGALYNHACDDADLAIAIAEGIRAVNRDLILFALPHTELAKAGERAGLPVRLEAFADRAYTAAGRLVSRKLPGAVIHDEQEAAARAVRMVLEGKVKAITGQDVALHADTICVHGDNPEAVSLIRAIRVALQREGVAVRSFAADNR